MRTKRFFRVVRSILCLMALSGVASAGSTVPLENSHLTAERLHLNAPIKSAYPGSARILTINTPFSQDPQRKIFMFDPDEGYRPVCRRCGPKHVLSYLREMERVSKKFKRRDMVWYYQEAWEFVARRVYGALPPPADLSHGLAFNPDEPPLPLPPAGPRPELKQQPLRKIVKLVTRPYRTWELTYEQLECGHELLAPAGYSVPAKRRRCPDCAREAMAKKKTSRAVAAIAKAKAVGA